MRILRVRYFNLVRALVMICVLSLAADVAVPVSTQAECNSRIREAMTRLREGAGAAVDGAGRVVRVVASPFVRIGRAIHRLVHRGGRAQAEAIARILEEKRAEAMRAASLGEDATPQARETAWNDFLARWERELLERMEGPRAGYPELNELLAYFAGRSNRFRHIQGMFLREHGTMRYRLLAHFMQRMRSDGSGAPVGSVGTWGSHFWTLWNTRLRIPTRRPVDAAQLADLATEINVHMLRAFEEHPSYVLAWMRAVVRDFAARVRRDPERQAVWVRFAELFGARYRARADRLLRGVADDLNIEQMRPEVLTDFYRWGVVHTVTRRLHRLMIYFGPRTADRARAVYEEATGVDLATLDREMGGGFRQYLPQRIRDALVIRGNRDVMRQLLVDYEMNQLALELQFFIRAPIEGMLIYWMINDTLHMRAERLRDEEYENRVRTDPAARDRLLGTRRRAEEDLNNALQNLDGQIDDLTMQRTELTSWLAAHPNDPDAARRREELRRVNRRIRQATELRDSGERSTTEVHPN